MLAILAAALPLTQFAEGAILGASAYLAMKRGE